MDKIRANRERDKAIVLAMWYFELIASKSGIKWNSDNNAEIVEMIDYIIAAAVEEAKAEIMKAMHDDPALAEYQHIKAQQRP